MTAKLRIKTKGIEIEWEGEVEFLKSEVPDLIASIIQAIGGAPVDSTGDDVGSDEPLNNLQFTTAAAAAKVQPKTAAELFKVALAKLQISDGVEPASRAAVLEEMKAAPKFYKPTMSGNLTKTIDALLAAGEINEPSTGNFALSQAQQNQLQTRISQ